MQQKEGYVGSTFDAGLAGEAGGAYKDVNEVIEAAELAGISQRVAQLTLFGNIKG